MSTAEAIKDLPGIDNAPDVYATPDFNDDATESTIDTSPEGGSESDTSHEDEDDSYGVSHRRLYPERARSRFDAESRGVDTKGADLSDRVDGRRKGYKVRQRREDDETETLEAKIARLKREVEECRVEAEQEKQEGEGGEDEGGAMDAVEALSRMMSGLDVPPATKFRRGHARAGSAYHDAPTIPPSSTEQPQQEQQHAAGEHTLTNVTAFDSRLAAIETALGLSSLDAATELSALTSPLLPTIALLDHQVATLSSGSSLSALEAASSRIHKLKAEAAELSHLQSQTAQSTATSDAEDDNSESESSPPLATLSSDDMASLKSLYTILPTLQSLSPMVPALTNRLRSLRTIHTAAASAHSDLDALEERQAEMDKELKMWREGLEKVEEAVEQATEQNEKNGKFVKTWVDDLEGRVKALKR